MSAFKYEKDADGIVTVTMDMTGPVNAMNEEYRQAMALAQSKLATIGIETPLRPSESFGEFGSGYRWQVRIRPYWEPQMQISGQTLQAGQAAPILPASLMLVEVQVQWGGIEKPRRAILTTLRLASGVAS